MANKNNRNDSRQHSADVFAPYNFISFAKTPVYVKNEGEIAGHDLMAETPDGEKLYSGEIHYTLEAKTPIFVDDGTKEHRFCKNAEGRYIVPGSTMRGLIRSNATVLGLGNVIDDVDDYSLMFRNVASGLNKKRYGEILGAGIARLKNGNKEFSLSVLKNVRAGYIEKTKEGKFIIRKTVIDPDDEEAAAIDQSLGKMNYYTLSERFIIERYLEKEKEYKNNPDSFPFSFLIPGMQSQMMNLTKPFRKELDRNKTASYRGVNNYAYIPYHRPVAYRLTGTRNVSEVKKPEKVREGYFYGELVSTGFMQKKKVVYVIPEADPDRIALTIDDRDIRDFQIDYNKRKNSLTLERRNPNRENERKIDEYKAFFNLPEKVGEKGRKPVFYIQLGRRCYFGFTPRLRLYYDKTVADGIGKNHIKGKVDYVKAIFGYTFAEDRKGASPGRDGSCARKTRVSFSDAVQTGAAKVLNTRYLTLSEPRPTDCLNYLEQSDNDIFSNNYNSYNSDKMRLRGIKQYWLHEEADSGKQPGEANKKLDSEMNPLDAGCKFRGVIRFKNLRGYELGLLLWSVRLEDNSWMNVGKGKSYGYGAVKLKLDEDSLQCVDFAKAYDLSGASDHDQDLTASLFGDFYEHPKVEELIEEYKQHVKRYNRNCDIMTLPLIKDFFAMKDSTRIPYAEVTRYMSLEQFQLQNRYKAALPTVKEVVEYYTDADS